MNAEKRKVGTAFLIIAFYFAASVGMLFLANEAPFEWKLFLFILLYLSPASDLFLSIVFCLWLMQRYYLIRRHVSHVGWLALIISGNVLAIIVLWIYEGAAWDTIYFADAFRASLFGYSLADHVVPAHLLFAAIRKRIGEPSLAYLLYYYLFLFLIRAAGSIFVLNIVHAVLKRHFAVSPVLLVFVFVAACTISPVLLFSNILIRNAGGPLVDSIICLGLWILLMGVIPIAYSLMATKRTL